MIVAFVGALVLAAGAVYWLLSGRAGAQKRESRESKAAATYSAVEIRPRSGACDAARALQGRRFLSTDAPALPLAKCTAAPCRCRFAKLSDRRTDGRRLEHDGLSAALFLPSNRRKRRDRRRTEQSPEG
jgi:hypothetical protein